MSALVFERNLARFAASRLASALSGPGRGTPLGPLRLTEATPPELPGPGWVRVRPRLAGICGSDLSTVDGRSSRYFEDIVSFPFVPGHEVVGTVEADATSGAATVSGAVSGSDATLAPGTRVVVEPVLGCTPRNITPPCPACAAGHNGNCERVAFGHLAPGLQIGFCADTGGGWSSTGLVAHRSQLHPVPDALSDDGLDLAAYNARFHTDVTADFPEVSELGAFVESSPTTIKLTPEGLARADAIGPWLASDSVKKKMAEFDLR